MNLYLVERTDQVGFDVFESLVVAAETEQAALAMVPVKWDGTPSRWGWSGDEHLAPWKTELEGDDLLAAYRAAAPPRVCTLIGTAVTGTSAGVVHALFIHG